MAKIKVTSNVDMNRIYRKFRATLGLVADTEAKTLECKAKKNAPWQDRTRLARNTIQGKSVWKGSQLIIYIAGHTNYFPYLELAYGKKYAILKPTINQNASAIVKRFQRLVL
jgi:hypothetical protein